MSDALPRQDADVAHAEAAPSLLLRQRATMRRCCKDAMRHVYAADA